MWQFLVAELTIISRHIRQKMCRAAAAAAAAATKPAIFPLLVFAPEFSISDKEMPKKSE